jgi:hypothetical protein
LNRKNFRRKIAASDSALASPFLLSWKRTNLQVALAGNFSYSPAMKKFLAALCTGLALSSCVPSTPQTRIQQNPRLFSSLSSNQQSLVQQGQLCRGMSPDAVFLAWGRQSGSFQGSKDGKLTERWDYAGTQPVMTTSVYSTYGYGYGSGYGRYGHGRYGYGRYGGPVVGVGIGPEVAYIPYRYASVWFVNQRVDSWERAR